MAEWAMLCREAMKRGVTVDGMYREQGAGMWCAWLSRWRSNGESYAFISGVDMPELLSELNRKASYREWR
jgi:hypothetical protein